MATSAGSRLAPPAFISDSVAHRQLITNWMRAAHQGHLGNVGTVTLATGTANTAVVDARIGPESVIHLMPTTLNAAGALTTTFIIQRTQELFTIAHENSAAADRVFAYSILG